MGARLRVFLNSEEEQRLWELQRSPDAPQRVKDRAEAVRLSHLGWYVEAIATHLHWHISTVRNALNRWLTGGLDGLLEALGRGRKQRWTEEDMKYIENILRTDPRSYSCEELAEKLEKEREVKLSGDQLRRILKERGIIWKRNRISHKDRQDAKLRECKQANLDMLEMAAASGEIDLLYGDESGFCLWSAVVYGYFFQGEQKRQEQTARRGHRLSVMGLLQPLVGFIFSFVLGSFKSKDFIELMEHQAKIAEENLQKFGRIRVITLDNGSIHTSKAVKAKMSEWESRGLFFFFLAPYCSEMNPIELEWKHLKCGEIRGEMFESEPELAYHVLEGIEARGEANGHQVEYVNLRPNLKPAM